MKKLLIFGSKDLGELAHYYFTQELGREVVAFTLDREFISEESFCSLPIVAFEGIETRFPPSEYEVFVAVSYAKMNQLREQKCKEARDKGYTLAKFVSPHAYVAKNAVIGDNCFILENVVVQPFVRIEDNVTIWSGTHVGHHSIIRENNFIASQILISGGVEVGKNCFLGVNATLRDHIKIGDRCIIGASAIILGETEPDGVYPSKATERAAIPSSRIKNI